MKNSLFLLPRHQNTHYNRDNTLYSKNILYIMNLTRISQSKSERYQESLCSEKLQSGGKPRTTFSTGYEPKQLATFSRISRITDPYQLYDVQKEFGEQGHQAPITEEVKEFGEIRTHGLPDSEMSETVLLPIAHALRRFREKHCRF